MGDSFPERRKCVRRSPRGDPTEFFQNFQYEGPTYDEVARADLGVQKWPPIANPASKVGKFEDLGHRNNLPLAQRQEQSR